MQKSKQKKVLLTGATGYIGKRILPELVALGYHVVCMVREARRFAPPEAIEDLIDVIEGDLLEPESLQSIPEDIDGAFYLVHSMSSSDEYSDLEERCAVNFRERMDEIGIRHVVYLSGIVNEEELSDHLKSRLNVENELKKGTYALTTLRAGIIIGSGSASFEIIRDLVEKLPVMIAPKWLLTECQPIAIRDVIRYLTRTIFDERMYNDSYDIGGPNILTYREMLLQFAEVRGLKRRIFIVPVMTPRLSSYWLYFVCSTSYRLAQALVESMKIKVVCQDDRIRDLIETENLTYRDSIRKAFEKIQNKDIISSWKDAFVSGGLNINVSDFLDVPEYGCFKDVRTSNLRDREKTIDRIWRLGGKTGWYYGNWMWRIRGLLDKMVGGVGLRRGRTNDDKITAGDAIDFWRVLIADRERGRLLLFAEMKLPGEAWLEFRIRKDQLVQTATFRPKGLLGRLYWYSVFPFHGLVFQGMIDRLVK